MTPSPWLVLFQDLSGRPRRERLCEAMRQAIHLGHLTPGQKMPSTRQLAVDLSLSRVTTEAAYSQLESEGYLTRYQGRGSFVSETPRRIPRPAVSASAFPARALSVRGQQIADTGGCQDPAFPLPFAAGSPDVREFPLDLWRKIYTGILNERGRSLMGYGDPQGLPELRTVIRDYLALSRQVSCSPEQIVILSSSQQALQLLSLLLLDPGDTVLTEQACYPGASNAFLSAGAQLIPLTLDAEGAQVPDRPARLAYLTAAHQYPLGMSLSAARRNLWLDWAKQHNSWLIEDDYDGEFHYQNAPLPALHSADRHGRVIYLGTFSKSLFPSLRLAWMVLPPALVSAVVRAHTVSDGHTPQLSQAVTATFIRQGHFAHHLRRMRMLYAARRQLLISSLDEHLSSRLRLMPGDGGLQLTVELLHGDEQLLTRQARQHGLILPPLSPLYITQEKKYGWILGYSALQRAEILRACQVLREVMG